MNQAGAPRRTTEPPEWLVDPIVGWVYLASSVVLVATALWPINFVLAAVGAAVAYQERTAHGFPAFWWTVGAFFLGPLGYLLFIYKRPRDAVVYTPHAAIHQQARMARGLPPKAPAVASRSATEGGGAPADWYPDPLGAARVRYWDGSAWTDHISS